MIINLTKMNYYYLTCNNLVRKKHMEDHFKSHNITAINPISMDTGISKFQSGASGFCLMLSKAISNFNNNFQPFVLLEDDIKKYREFPEFLNVPDDCDILYIGISSWGLNQNRVGQCMHVCYDSVENYDDIVRVYNMCSTHGFIITSIKGLMIFQKCMLEDYYTNKGYDITLAHMQSVLNAYALRQPLVYQWSSIGGQERATRFSFLKKNNIIDEKLWKYENTFTHLTSTLK